MFQKFVQSIAGHIVDTGGEKKDGCAVFMQQQREALPGSPLPFLFISLHNGNIIRYGPRVNDAVTETIKNALESLDIEVKEFGDFRGVVQWELVPSLFYMALGSTWEDVEKKKKEGFFSVPSYQEGLHEVHVKSIRLINRIVEGLATIGWQLQLTPETNSSVITSDDNGTHHYSAKSTMCFLYKPVDLSAPPKRLFAIEAHSRNRLLVVDGPPLLPELVKQCIERVYTYGFTKKEAEMSPFTDPNGAGGLEFALDEGPFHMHTREKTAHLAHLLMAEIIKELRERDIVQIALVSRNSNPMQRPMIMFEYNALLDNPATSTISATTSSASDSSTISYVDMIAGDTLRVYPVQAELDKAVHDALEAEGFRIQKEKTEKEHPTVNEIKLKGWPFMASKHTDYVQLMRLHLRFLAHAERVGLSLIGHARPMEWFGVQTPTALYFESTEASNIVSDYLALTPVRDRLNVARLGDLIVDIEAIIEECVRLCWTPGVQKKDGDIRGDDLCCSYKLKGYMFTAGTQISTPSDVSILNPLFFTVLISMVLEADASIELVGSFQWKKHASGGDTIVFRRKNGGGEVKGKVEKLKEKVESVA